MLLDGIKEKYGENFENETSIYFWDAVFGTYKNRGQIYAQDNVDFEQKSNYQKMADWIDVMHDIYTMEKLTFSLRLEWEKF